MKTAREIREALRGFEDLFDEEGNLFVNDVHTGKTLDVVVEKLIAEAVLAEREACAQICDSIVGMSSAHVASRQIRARSSNGDAK